jgi:hypothetical protein
MTEKFTFHGFSVARSAKREEGVSEDRSKGKQTNSLRARGPRGLEFRCGPAPGRLPAPPLPKVDNSDKWLRLEVTHILAAPFLALSAPLGKDGELRHQGPIRGGAVSELSSRHCISTLSLAVGIRVPRAKMHFRAARFSRRSPDNCPAQSK